MSTRAIAGKDGTKNFRTSMGFSVKCQEKCLDTFCFSGVYVVKHLEVMILAGFVAEGRENAIAIIFI